MFFFSPFALTRSGVSGSVYDLAASPSLADLLKNVSAQVPDPHREGKSLADPKEDQGDNDNDEKLKVLDVAALGSGSGSSRVFVYMASLPEGSRLWLPAADGDCIYERTDFTVFLQRLGLASANFGMRRGRKDPGARFPSPNICSKLEY